jgi:RNA polymerase sigma-70 factor (ECF subfamily)
MDPESPPADDDGALVRRSVGGDSDAYRVLYERYQDRVFATVHRIVGDYEEAVDVTQDVFVKVYRELPSFAFQSKFSTWLYRIAVNFSINKVNERERHGRVHRKLALDAGEADRADPPVAVERVHAAIQELSPKLRAVVALRYLQNLTYEEIADVLDLSVGTVKSRLHLAHEALREALGTLLKG